MKHHSRSRFLTAWAARRFYLPITSLLLLLATFGQTGWAAIPGLPFTENFSDDSLQDPLLTTANWSTEEEALMLDWRRKQYRAFQDLLSGTNITADAQRTYEVALGDMDGDGDLDLVAANYTSTVNRLYLNNGTSDPFDGVSGSNITNDAKNTAAIALGDVDNDGDLDMIAGNTNDYTLLYLNNGTSDPFDGVTSRRITDDIYYTRAVALGDMDGDGDLDLVVGNGSNRINRLYLNNGTADPFSDAVGIAITSDSYETISIALGDVDEDGDLDVVAGNFYQTNRLYLNNGTADPFNGVSGVNITNDVHFTYHVALGDMDGDGDLDVVAGSNGHVNRLYLNNGTASPFNGVSGTNITADAQNTRAVALGDIDGDGDLDVVAGNGNQANRLYLNNGSPNPFSGVSGLHLTNDTQDTSSVILGDVDGDGDLDLITGNESPLSNPNTNRLYLNNGTSNPLTGDSDDLLIFYAGGHGGQGWHRSTALGDVDNDGDLDLVVGDRDDLQPNHLLLNNGTTTPFTALLPITAETYITYQVLLGDVDNDGDLDLVAGNYGQTNRLYLNNGTADPWDGVSGSDITSDVDDTYAAALGDIDNDGDLDFLAASFGGPVRLYPNNGTADPFNGISGSEVANDGAYAIALGDVNGDGHLDLVVGNSQGNLLYSNNGTAAPFNGVAGLPIDNEWHDTFALSLGDVDGDGDMDIISGNKGLGYNRLHLNNGTADPFNGVTSINITADRDLTVSTALADIDNDGDLDFIAGNYVTNRLYLNNGTANPFEDVNGYDLAYDTTDHDITYSVSLGDVDGDGDLDMVNGNDDIGTLVYLSNGMPDPWNGVISFEFTEFYNGDRCVALGDVDNDGDLDLVTADYYGENHNRVYLNNGTADPWQGVSATPITYELHGTTGIALGDMDNDGDLDLVVGNFNERNRLYLNNGTGASWTASDITSDILGTFVVALGDVDNDGDLDMVAGNGYEKMNRLYLNNGTADPFNGVSGSNITSDAHTTTSIALGDMDNDGDLDLVVGNPTNASRLYLNNGTANPFSGISGVNITNDAPNANRVRLGDMDNDGDLDVVAYPRLYLNNGTATAWVGSDITSDTPNSKDIALGDWDHDGDLDLIATIYGGANRLYLNNGTASPFSGVNGIDIPGDTWNSYNTQSVALGDVDNNGLPDIVTGNYYQPNRLYQRELYHTARGTAISRRVDAETNPISYVYLTVSESLPVHTNVDYWVSNNGGARWFLTQSNSFFNFSTAGTDLRWRAELHSLSPERTPKIDNIGLSLSETRTQCGLGLAAYRIGFTQPITVTVADVGTLDCVTVDYFPASHSEAVAGIQTEAYWTIEGHDDVGNPATDFDVTVTLPHTLDPHTDAKVCKYPGTQGGDGWDCTRTGSNEHTVWLEGIGSFSDWAVGMNVGPTAVSIQTFSAISQVGWVGLLVGLLALAAGILRLRCRKR